MLQVFANASPSFLPHPLPTPCLPFDLQSKSLKQGPRVHYVLQPWARGEQAESASSSPPVFTSVLLGWANGRSEEASEETDFGNSY